MEFKDPLEHIRPKYLEVSEVRQKAAKETQKRQLINVDSIVQLIPELLINEDEMVPIYKVTKHSGEFAEIKILDPYTGEISAEPIQAPIDQLVDFDLFNEEYERAEREAKSRN